MAILRKKAELDNLDISDSVLEYVASNPDVMSEDGFRISLELLCNKKYLECPILDVRDDSVMNGYVLVTYDSNTNSYNYEYKSE